MKKPRTGWFAAHSFGRDLPRHRRECGEPEALSLGSVRVTRLIGACSTSSGSGNDGDHRRLLRLSADARQQYGSSPVRNLTVCHHPTGLLSAWATYFWTNFPVAVPHAASGVYGWLAPGSQPVRPAPMRSRNRQTVTGCPLPPAGWPRSRSPARTLRTSRTCASPRQRFAANRLGSSAGSQRWR